MNIGFVTTWFERGAAYVTKAYIDLLKDENNIFVYARGGESFAKNDKTWNKDYVTWGLRFLDTHINFNHFKKWLIKNKIDTLFFNEQHDIEIILKIKRAFPNVKIGSYIDYYKEDTVLNFWEYDFLICNTKRHYSVFENHPQCYFVKWGTDIDLFSPQNKSENKNEVVFFHSVGMSNRKGTDILVNSFIENGLYKKGARLVLHTQIDIKRVCGYSAKELLEYNIDVIFKTVSAPGLYFMGDVYVYPSTLEGLGLTIYEAMACGLPVITTDNPPMNEAVCDLSGKTARVLALKSRSDGYFWPMSICDKNSLAEKMQFYIDNKDSLEKFKKDARDYAVLNFNWQDRKKDIINIFKNSKLFERNNSEISAKINKIIKLSNSKKKDEIIKMLPDILQHFINIIRTKR